MAQNKKDMSLDECECCGGNCGNGSCCQDGACPTNETSRWSRFGRFGFFGFVAMLAAILVLVGIVRGILRDQVQFDQRNSFTVSGKGRIFAKPDIAVLFLGLKTERQKTASDAVTENTKKMNEVYSKLKSNGVEEKDIKTTGYYLNPVYDYAREGSAGPDLLGYEVMQNVDVKIRDLSKVGVIIKAATDAGANQVGNISFTIDDPENLKAEARAEAIAMAQAKAKTMAKAADFELGDIMSIYENEVPVGPMPYYDKAVSIGGIGGGGSVPAPEIQAGQNEIVVEINVTYQIED